MTRSGPAPSAPPGPGPTTCLVVAGAHLRGEPLHPTLLALGARFVRATRTAPVYRMVALPALDRPATPPRPGLVRDPSGGEAMEVELYELPVAALGHLVLTVAPPLAIGTVTLADGSAAPGFVCEGYAVGAVLDISRYGGWRSYLAARAAAAAPTAAPSPGLHQG
jgi:allophanate hydrolase